MAPGSIRLGAVLFVVVVGAGIYLAVQFIPPYWTYFRMQDVVREAVLSSAGEIREASARGELIRRGQGLGLTLIDENIEIKREGAILLVRVRWVATVDLPRYRHRIPFLIEERVRAQ